MIKLLNVASIYSALFKVVEFCKENDGEEIEIIVPDKLSLFMEKFLFERLNISASFDIKVSTLNRFAKRKLVLPKENQISKIGSILLINKILNENLENLKVLKSKVFSFSYAENIFQTISQLKASKISYEEMLMFDSQDLQLKDKILDIALVYQQYENYKAGLLDAADAFLMSTLTVAEGLCDRQILFVGFDDFTAIEYSIIERLAAENNVHILTYYANSGNKHIYNNEVISQIKNICFVNDVNLIIEDVDEKIDELKSFMEKNLFAFNDNKFLLKAKPVKVFSANNIREEIELVARDIRYKILNSKRYNEFGVAVFGLETYVDLVKEIFSKYELNYYIDNELTLSNSIFYKFLISVIKYNLESYNLTHLIDIINSPFYEEDDSIKQAIINKLISISFKGKVKQDFAIGINIEAEQKLLAFLQIFDFNFNNASEVINKLKSSIIEIDVDGKIDVLANEVELQEKILLTKSKDAIFNIFDEILKFYNGINAGQFLDILERVSGVVKIKNLPQTLDAVKIVDANNTMEIFNNFYIVNCTSNLAPNLKYDCGIIVDNEIEKLTFKHKLAPTIAHINRLAKLRLFNTIQMFENSLTISYCLNPSDVILELLKRIQIQTQEGVTNIVPLTPDNSVIYSALSDWDYTEYVCKNCLDYEKINKKIVKIKKINNISHKNLIIYENLKEISATQLENYFKCPFYSFMQNTLKIKPRLSSDILSFDIGNILHEIVFKYYSLKKQVGDIYEFCKKEVYSFANSDERLKQNLTSPILTALIDEAVRVINGVDYVDKNSSFVPYKFEYEFGGKTALKLNNIAVKGKVDRVDVCNDMMRVIDYKSGKAEASLKELYYGNKLQLFLYSLAMENLLNKKLVGSFYLPLHNAYTKEVENTYTLKGFFINEDFVLKALDSRLNVGETSDIINVTINSEFKAGRTKGVKKLEDSEMGVLKTYSKLVTEKAVEEIKQGYIKPSPSEVSEICNYCPYAHLCLKDCSIRCNRPASKVDIASFKEADDE